MANLTTIDHDESTVAGPAELRQFAVTGDAAAFARVVRGHVNLVYSLCRRELRGDAHLADDATQAVFILLARKAARLAEADSLVGWLYTAARNCSRNARRASLRRERHELEAAKHRREIMEHNARDAAEQAEVEQAVHEAITRLDAGQRDLLLMRFFQQMTLDEVGRAIGISEDAARQRVTRAVGSLRAIMEGSGGMTIGAALPLWLESHAVIEAPPAVAQAAMKISAATGAGPEVIVKTFAGFGAAKWAALLCLVTAGLITAVATSQPATAPSATPAPTSQPTGPVSVTVRALIDGHDHLLLKGSTARWRHFEFAAPGMINGRNEATTINGVAWHPTWEDSDMDKEVLVAKSMSDTYDGITPPIPSVAGTVTLQKIRGRGTITVVQQPAADNDFTAIVDFDDNIAGGAAWYEVKVTVTPQ